MRSSKFFMVIFFIALHFCVRAQEPKRRYVSENFAVELDGLQTGWIQPVRKGDTLVYSISNLADSTRIRKKFDTVYGAMGKRYILVYKRKKAISTRKPG